MRDKSYSEGEYLRVCVERENLKKEILYWRENSRIQNQKLQDCNLKIEDLEKIVRNFDLIRILTQSGLLRRITLSTNSSILLSEFLDSQISHLLSSSGRGEAPEAGEGAEEPSSTFEDSPLEEGES